MSSNGRALARIVFWVILSPLMTAQAGAADSKAADSKAQQTKAPAAKPAPVANLTAEQIVDKYMAARGGAQAWKAVQTMQLSGKVDAGRGDSDARAMQMVRSGKKYAGKQGRVGVPPAPGETKDGDKQVQLPFTLDVKRPHMSRLEIEFAGKTAVQVYDGTHGWKVRPFLNRNDVEPFTAEETRSEAARDGLEGPLFDYAAKGTKVSLEKVEAVEGSSAYKLKLTQKDGTTQHVWIDAKTFLDVKVDGAPRRMDGRMHQVWVYQRDFRPVQGVMIPFVLETAVDGYPDTHKMIIEKAAVNPKLDDALFAKPRA